jgi:protein-S-isoprenylcysteine O-methyltransferase Ste14
MAKNLNKNRIRDSKIIFLVVIFFALFGKSPVSENEILHELAEGIGILFVSACALGRLYTTAFIGGQKNVTLVTHGPYSLCRNPLYFLSLIGAIGVGLASAHIISVILSLGGFLMLYRQLIAREEEFLEEKFRDTFNKYKKTTPRLWPSFKNYKAPAELTFQSKLLTNALKDSIWWFMPIVIFEIGDLLRESGLYQTFIPLF